MEKLRKQVKVFWLSMSRVAPLVLVVVLLFSCGSKDSKGELGTDDIHFNDDGHNKNAKGEVISEGAPFKDDGYAKKPEGDLPEIEFVEDEFDFGVMLQGESTVLTYHFKNTGKNDLSISNVKPACGCTTVTEYSKHVPPGEEGNVTVAFNGTNQQGEIDKKIVVYTNCFPSRSVLSIKGEVLKTNTIEQELNQEE